MADRFRATRSTTRAVTAAAVLVAALTAYLLKDACVELWHLAQLENEGERSVAAAQALGASGSLKAIPTLLRHLERSEAELLEEAAVQEVFWEWVTSEFENPAQLAELFPGDPYYAALLSIYSRRGTSIVPVLANVLKNQDAGAGSRYLVLRFLMDLGPAARAALPEVRLVASADPRARVRDAALQTLESLGGEL